MPCERPSESVARGGAGERTESRLLAALERAVRDGAFSAKSVERILAVQARPKTCWDRMAEETSHLGDLLSDNPTPPWPATEYQHLHLLFQESSHGDNTGEKTTPARAL